MLLRGYDAIYYQQFPWCVAWICLKMVNMREQWPFDRRKLEYTISMGGQLPMFTQTQMGIWWYKPTWTNNAGKIGALFSSPRSKAKNKATASVATPEKTHLFFPGSDDIEWYLQCFATITANLRLETEWPSLGGQVMFLVSYCFLQGILKIILKGCFI